jgi:hypothetical protein
VKHVSVLGRLGISTAAGLGAGVVAAIVVTVIDLYITGHGYGSITRELITWTPAGVHLSIGDLAMLMAVVAGAGSTWHLVGLSNREA